MRILLAEDDRMLNRALCYQLENLDFQVDSCLDGEDALFYGEQNIYDVILLDRMLPGMEGTEILTALRAKGISTPIIMITALGTLSDKVKGLDLGADDYLVKPFAFEELMARIRCVTRRSPILTPSDPSKVCLEDLTLFYRRKAPNGTCRAVHAFTAGSRPDRSSAARRFKYTNAPYHLIIKGMGTGQRY